MSQPPLQFLDEGSQTMIYMNLNLHHDLVNIPKRLTLTEWGVNISGLVINGLELKSATKRSRFLKSTSFVSANYPMILSE